MSLRDDYLSQVTRLRRSKNGDTIHAADCKRAANTVPWIWAEALERSQILAACEQSGLRRCRICDPLWENDERTRTVLVWSAS